MRSFFIHKYKKSKRLHDAEFFKQFGARAEQIEKEYVQMSSSVKVNLADRIKQEMAAKIEA